ncbi:ankyrin [Paragonimus westermani]|uniref:Ankyrin n=1 Tax=Paragonimus westermani TaxID=34504 RepID=A0A5J4NWD4_9TREM|nr:ankyrin [Paragonimus westermani]
MLRLQNGLNALHLASKEGHHEVVRELLARGADPNRATKKGNTALHIASLAGQFEVVKILLDAGSNVNTQAQNGFTPLYMAAQENHLEVVKLLLTKHANPALTTDDGFTPLAVALQQGHDRIVALLLENDSRGKVCLPALHIAAKKDDVKAANLLLNSDVNVDHQSSSGFTPLHIAAHYGNVNMTDLLISRGANINFQAKNNITPLHVACKWGNHGVAERLIKANAELDCRTRDGLTPLHCASRSGHDIVVQLLLNANANFGAKTRSGLNALHMAAQGDHVDTARLLLQRGLPLDDTTIDFLTALHVAAHCGNVQVAKLLLERGCDVNTRALNGFTPLHIACQKNRIKIVELLLKYNCMIEATTESGLTPLHVASFMGHLSIVVLLLQHGANPNCPTVRSETALHLAARAGQTEVARLLLRNGAQVDVRARGHQTPLHIASRIGSTELVSLLLENSAHLQAATKDTYTPLHLAAKANHTEVCQILLRAGAQLETVTRSGFTPLHLATKHLHPEAVELLLSHGANVNACGRNGLTSLHLAAHYGSVNLVRLLLEHKANPLDQAKNGFTPLHIAAEKRFLEVARLLIAAIGPGDGCNTESRNGFMALHLACQDGSPEMTKLLLDSGAKVNARAKNGLTPMHLAAQEDSLEAAVLLYAHGSELDAKTKAGYTPLHTACHFGQYNWTPAHVARRQHYLNIFEVLRQVTTCVESWELEDEELMEPALTDADLHKPMVPGAPGTRHLLEQPDVMGDHPVTDTEEECIEPDYTLIPASPLFSRAATQEQHRPTDDVHTRLQFRLQNADRQSRGALDKLSTMSGEDSIHENPNADLVWRDSGIGNGVKEPVWSATQINRDFAKHGKEVTAALSSTTDWDFTPDNVPIARKPITTGFLVSFLVDARGGSMRGSRHPGLRVLVPPSAASAPTRVTCRMLRPERTTRPPQLNDSEGLACRIIELGPYPCTFNTPVLLEIPHFASLRGRQRELVVLRSDNGETWREHSLEATDQAVQSALGQNFDTLETLEELREKRIIRILTNDFPQYLAVVSRLRQETAMIGSDGGVLSSTVVPQVQAVFPEGALQKRIRVGLQAHPIPTDMVTRLLGNRVALSPIVTLEPRRRKFHKPITLTIPLPKTAMRGMLNPTTSDLKTQSTPSLRLLCSITGGTLPAQWEDITGSTPLSKVKDCVSFTTTVSARFWLLDCQNVHDSTELAGQLYREASLVPYMGKFVVFTKRLDADEALIRCFCVTDDKVDKTLECQEGFEVCAASPEVEVVEGRPAWLDAAGNLLPVAKSGEQLNLMFNAFRENRLAFPVRVRDMQAEPTGKLAFMREPRTPIKAGVPDSSYTPQKPICTLEVNIGLDQSQPAANSTMVDLGLLSLSEQLNTSVAATSAHSIPCVFPQPHSVDQTGQPGEAIDMGEKSLYGSENRLASVYAADVIARSQLDLLQVANEVGADWPLLVGMLLPESHLDTMCTVEQLVDWITQNEPRWAEAREVRGVTGDGIGAAGFAGLTVADLRTDRDQALAVLLSWREQRGDLATGNELDRALRAIGRVDVVKSCMRDIQCVTEEEEHAQASKLIDQPFGQEQTQLVSSEPASTSVVGTVTLMSGMDDLPNDQYGGASVDGELNEPREPDEPQLTPKTIIQQEAGVPILAKNSLEEKSEAERDQTELEDTEGGGLGMFIRPDYISDEHIGPEETEVDVADERVEESWQMESPPAVSTSQQGGDPFLLSAAQELRSTNEDADIVRDSESMTASVEGTSETTGEADVKAEDLTSPSGNSTVPEVIHDVAENDQEHSLMLNKDTEIRNEEETPTADLQESVVDNAAEDEHLVDAHHTGGERPSSGVLSVPVRCYSEEGVEMVEEDVIHDLPMDQTSYSEAQSHVQNLQTAHHGVISQPEEKQSQD